MLFDYVAAFFVDLASDVKIAALWAAKEIYDHLYWNALGFV